MLTSAWLKWTYDNFRKLPTSSKWPVSSPEFKVSARQDKYLQLHSHDRFLAQIFQSRHFFGACRQKAQDQRQASARTHVWLQHVWSDEIQKLTRCHRRLLDIKRAKYLLSHWRVWKAGTSYSQKGQKLLSFLPLSSTVIYCTSCTYHASTSMEWVQ